MQEEVIPLYRTMYQGLKSLGVVTVTMSQIGTEKFNGNWTSEVYYRFSVNSVRITVASLIGANGSSKEETEEKNRIEFEAFKQALQAIEEGEKNEDNPKAVSV